VWQENEGIIRALKARNVIQMYNALATVFVEYEIIYHTAWYEHVPQVHNSLTVPLLAKNPRTFRLVINFDPYITEAIRETEYMWKLGLKTPDISQIITFGKQKLFGNYEKVKNLVKINNNIRYG
jgi:dynein heavy chain